jgi:hypothetical protein
MARLAQDAAESLDGQIEEENLDGLVEAVEVRDALGRVQDLSVEVSEELDAYQQRHARQTMRHLADRRRPEQVLTKCREDSQHPLP